ncbi:hypothetical protein [Aquimarina rhabdastrellae]
MNQTSKQELKKNIKKWKEADIQTLSKHFHRLNTLAKGDIHFERVNKFVMQEDDIVRFREYQATIKGIKIHLALQKNNKKKFTFFPILEAILDSGQEEYFKLIPKKNTTENSRAYSAIVPGIFKEMIVKNWEEIENHLLDDLFIAETNKELKRVHYFVIDQAIVSLINKFEDIEAITLYPGVDMNKFNTKQMISFTPVLGILHKKSTETLQMFIPSHGLLEFENEGEKEEIFIEYSRPCPPTCEDQ